MPQTKRKRSSAIRTKKKRTPEIAKVSSTERIQIRRHKFAYLKKDPRFLALIKVGRLLNVLAFGMHTVHESMNDTSAVARRQYHRGTFIIGGYLHEGIRLAQSLRAQYHSKEYYQAMFRLAFDDQFERERKILQEIRDSVAFHLDSENKSTKAALEKLKLTRYVLASGDSDTVGEFYFDFADTIDLNYLIDKLNKGKTESEVFSDIYRTIGDFMQQFLVGGHEFVVGLGEEIEIRNYID